jgi:hypothetical protein
MLESEQVCLSKSVPRLSFTSDNTFICKKIDKVTQASSVRADDFTWLCQKLVSYHVMADYNPLVNIPDTTYHYD